MWILKESEKTGKKKSRETMWIMRKKVCTMLETKDILTLLPEMKSGKELASEMAILPKYNENVRNENQAIRLMALSDLTMYTFLLL